MPPSIDKALVCHSFGKHLFSYTQHAVIQAAMADDLIWRLQQAHPHAFARVFEIGCGSGVLTSAFLKRFAVIDYVANDLVDDCRDDVERIVRQYPDSAFDFAGGDIERLSPWPKNLDAIISNATFQWLADLPAFFSRVKAALKPGGLLAFSTFGPENLREIRQLTGVGLHYMPHGELYALLTQSFKVLCCEESVLGLAFDSPRAVLRHISLTGVNGVTKQTWTKGRLQEFEQQYWQQFGADEQVPLTYHPILCLAQA